MKLITLIQAGALLLLAVFGAYASTHSGAAPCGETADTETACEL